MIRALLASLLCLLALTACDNFNVAVHFAKPGVEGACAGVSNANCLEFTGADPSGVFRSSEIKVSCVSGTSQLLPSPSAGPSTSSSSPFDAGSLAAFGLQPGSSVVGALIQPSGGTYVYILGAVVQPGQAPVAQLVRVPAAELAAFSASFSGGQPPAGSQPFKPSDLVVIGQAAAGISVNPNTGATFIGSRFTAIRGSGAEVSPNTSQTTAVSSVSLSGVLSCKGA